MAAGKSRLGAEVAERLGRPFVDLDLELEARTGASIAELFRRGEPEFRVLEAQVVHDVLSRAEPAVVALGGGAVETDAVRELLRERALAVLVEVDERPPQSLGHLRPEPGLAGRHEADQRQMPR